MARAKTVKDELEVLVLCIAAQIKPQSNVEAQIDDLLTANLGAIKDIVAARVRAAL